MGFFYVFTEAGYNSVAIKYKKISPCIWNDAKVNRLSPMGKLAFVYMLTHPQQTAVGAIRTTIQGLGFEIEGLPKEAFAEAFAEGLAKASRKAPLIVFPNFIKYNMPESPNVAISWGKSFLDLPDCGLRDRLYSTIVQVLTAKGHTYVEAFGKGLGEGFAHSVPEPEAEAVYLQHKHTSTCSAYCGEWNCRKCGVVNPDSESVCSGCGEYV